jgi:hypothetical protein
MTKLSEILSDPSFLTLQRGGHHKREDGVCLMEAVAWWEGEVHTDRPQCVDLDLAELARNLNDTMLDHYREGFAALVPLFAGTRSDGLMDARKKAQDEFTRNELLPTLIAAVPEGKPLHGYEIDSEAQMTEVFSDL